MEKFQDQLSVKVIHEVEVVRHLSTITLENNWNDRSGFDGYEKYMALGPSIDEYNQFVKGIKTLGTVKRVLRIDAAYLIKALRSLWVDKGILHENTFQSDDLNLENGAISYDDVKYDFVILAMGWRGINEIFKTDVYRPVKGEVLIVEIPDFPEKRLVKFGKYIVPLGHHKFWIGSTYQWEWEDESSDVEKSSELEQFLKDELKVGYTILERKAGIRPSTKYRRPLIGRHPDCNNVFLMNGLGTKGVSMAPYWATQIIDDIMTDNKRIAISESFGRVWS